jgi:hypothetical protein
MTDWQDMDTVPKDGRWIAALYTNNMFDEVVAVRWNADQHYPWEARDNAYAEGRIVGWYPIPAPPRS